MRLRREIRRNNEGRIGGGELRRREGTKRPGEEPGRFDGSTWLDAGKAGPLSLFAHHRLFKGIYRRLARGGRVSTRETELLMVGFQKWIEQHFHVEAAISWNRIILFYSKDSFDALDQFFALFEEYNAGRRLG